MTVQQRPQSKKGHKTVKLFIPPLFTYPNTSLCIKWTDRFLEYQKESWAQHWDSDTLIPPAPPFPRIQYNSWIKTDEK